MGDDRFVNHVPSNDRAKLRATAVTIGTPDPRALAAFYARLLGADVDASELPHPGEPENAGWAQVRTATVTLNFEFERYWEAPVWPARHGRQVSTQHLDIWVDDLDGAVAWALECGARLAEHQPQDGVRVMRDPVGHPFCLFR